MGRLFPMTYFLPVSVGTFTKGLGFADLATNLAALALFIPVLTLAQPPAAAQAGALGRRSMHTLANIFWLGTKELRSFLRDFVLLGLVIYAFSLAVIAQAQSSSQEVHNASIAHRRRGPFGTVAPHRAARSCRLISRRRSRSPSATSSR